MFTRGQPVKQTGGRDVLLRIRAVWNALTEHAKTSFGLFILVAGPPLLLLQVGSHAKPHADGTVAFGLCLLGLVLLTGFAVISIEIGKDPKREHVGWAAFVAYFGLSAAAYLLVGAGYLAAYWDSHGVALTRNPLQANPDMGDIHGKVLYEALQVIPALDIPSTIGWEDPLADPTWQFGWLLLLIKAIVAFIIVSLFIQLIRGVPRMRRTPRNNDVSGQASQAGHATEGGSQPAEAE